MYFHRPDNPCEDQGEICCWQSDTVSGCCEEGFQCCPPVSGTGHDCCPQSDECHENGNNCYFAKVYNSRNKQND